MIYYKTVEKLDFLLKHLFHQIIFVIRFIFGYHITNLPTKFDDRNFSLALSMPTAMTMTRGGGRGVSHNLSEDIRPQRA